MRAAFDSNVLLYLASNDDRKATVAEQLLMIGGVITVQVLNEIANVTRRKMNFSWSQTHDFLDTIKPLVTINPVTVTIHQRGLTIAERYRLSIYDAMIAAAALEADCNILYSEDMHSGLIVDGMLTVQNPFNANPP